jgi:hypothetical protein
MVSRIDGIGRQVTAYWQGRPYLAWIAGGNEC